MDARLAALLDEREIRDVVYRYCRGVDRRDLELVRSCYHPDATDAHGSFSGGVDAFLAWLDRLLDRYAWTVHLVANLMVEPGAEPGHAAVESYGVALHRGRDDTAALNLATPFRYLDRFERRDGTWRIAERVALSDDAIHVPESAWWSPPDDHPRGHRGPEDALYTLLRSVRSRA